MVSRIEAKEFIFSYADGSVYMGQMVDGIRHGRGTLRTAAFVYGGSTHVAYTQDDAVENAHRAKWHEYIGKWTNDKMNGYGEHLLKSGDGSETVLFQGEWIDGTHQRQQRSRESGDQELESDPNARQDLELEIFGY